MANGNYRYELMTWPEIGAIAGEDRVVVQPIGTLEDHGPHLPIDCDVRIIDAICAGACARVPDQVILMPTLTHGFSPHHIDFPGSINVRWNVFVDYVVDVTRSLVQHGFRRIILANGHGSNMPLVNIAARLTVLEHPEAICADYFYLYTPKAAKVIESVRESAYPGGMAHACELETSIYLALEPGLVQMDKAAKDFNQPPSDYFFIDWLTGSGSLMEYWSTLTKNGTMGDPTVATAEKGEILLGAAVDELVMVIGEMKDREIRQRVDHHAHRADQREGSGRKETPHAMNQVGS